jgi:4a-hydroxytetrahydrobiopterin dehydratase
MKLTREQIQMRLSKLNMDWKLREGNKIEREFNFDNYQDTIEFVNKITGLAEDENHHPDIQFSYGKAKITLSTHEVEGLSEKDFTLASKIDTF